MLRTLEMLSQEIRKGFETEFEYSFFDNEARKMLDQEMKFLSSPDRKNLAEVLYILHQAVSVAPKPGVVFQGMYQMVLVPYILGLSQYNPFEPENCHREEHICNPRYVDLSLQTSKEGFNKLLITLYCQCEERVMLVAEGDAAHKYIIVAPEGIKIPDYYTKECDFILPMVRKSGGVVISITLNKLIDNYERLISVVPSGTGYYLRRAAYAMIAVDELDIWAGIHDSALLRGIMHRNPPTNLLDIVKNLQDYYADYFSPQFFYIQLAAIMLDIMCIHLANPDDFFYALITDREKAILDNFEDVEIMDMFWDPLMREKANRPYYRKLSDKNTRLMAYTAEKHRDELLMCMAYIYQE